MGGFLSRPLLLNKLTVSLLVIAGVSASGNLLSILLTFYVVQLFYIIFVHLNGFRSVFEVIFWLGLLALFMWKKRSITGQQPRSLQQSDSSVNNRKFKGLKIVVSTDGVSGWFDKTTLITSRFSFEKKMDIKSSQKQQSACGI